MDADAHGFRLSPTEARFLATLHLDPELRARLSIVPRCPVEPLSVVLSRLQCERLRDQPTRRLAETGFQLDYSLAAEGRMLVDLIDRFHVTE